jgi:hypothetical protein
VALGAWADLGFALSLTDPLPQTNIEGTLASPLFASPSGGCRWSPTTRRPGRGLLTAGVRVRGCRGPRESLAGALSNHEETVGRHAK